MTPQIRAIGLPLALFLAGCASTVVAPDWQLNAQASIERATEAYLSGNAALEAVEFARARAQVASTGRLDLVARAELVRCATRVASLVFDDCSGFTALAQDAPGPERAYADYLAGHIAPQQVTLLPPQHRAVAAAAGTGAALADIADPLARLVAAGVLMRSARADPQTITVAIDTASARGWRRPLLAWLGVQSQRAEQAGDAAEVARLRRRMALVGETGSRAP